MMITTTKQSAAFEAAFDIEITATMSRDEVLEQHWNLIFNLIRKRIEGFHYRIGRTIRPCELDELHHEAVAQCWKYIDDVVYAVDAEKVAVTAAVFAARRVIGGDRLCGSLGDGCKRRSKIDFDHTVDIHEVLDRKRYEGPTFEQLLLVLNDREQTIARALVAGVKKVEIAETLNISDRQLRNINRKIGEKLFPLVTS